MSKKKSIKKTRKKRTKKPFIFEEEFNKFVNKLIKGTDNESSFKQEFYDQLKYLDNIGLSDFRKSKLNNRSSPRIRFYNYHFKSIINFKQFINGLKKSEEWFKSFDKKNKEDYEFEKMETYNEKSNEFIVQNIKDIMSYEQYISFKRKRPQYLNFMIQLLDKNKDQIFMRISNEERQKILIDLKEIIDTYKITLEEIKDNIFKEV